MAVSGIEQKYALANFWKNSVFLLYEKGDANICMDERKSAYKVVAS